MPAMITDLTDKMTSHLYCQWEQTSVNNIHKGQKKLLMMRFLPSAFALRATARRVPELRIGYEKKYNGF